MTSRVFLRIVAFSCLTCVNIGCGVGADGGAGQSQPAAGYGADASDSSNLDSAIQEHVDEPVSSLDGSTDLPRSDCGESISVPLTPGVRSGTFTCRTDKVQPSEPCSDGLASLGTATFEDIYTFDLADPARVSYLIERDTAIDEPGLGRPRLVLYLRGATADPADEVACYSGNLSGGRAFVMVDLLPGRYTLVVESYAQEGEAAQKYRLHTAVDCGPLKRFSVVSQRCEADPSISCTGENKHRYETDGPGCACDPGASEDPKDPDRCLVNTQSQGESATDPLLLTGPSGKYSVRIDTARDDEMLLCGLERSGDRIFALFTEEPVRLHMNATLGQKPVGQSLRVAVRRDTPSPAAEIDCLEALPIAIDLEPGLYYIIVEALPGKAPSGLVDIDYRVSPDPCGKGLCPDGADCVRAGGAKFECLCPAGSILSEGTCVADPCTVEPCASGSRTRCDASSITRCSCPVGYLSQGQDCVPDPAAAEWGILLYYAADDPILDESLSVARDEVQRACAAGQCNDSVRVVMLVDSLYKNGGTTRILSLDRASDGTWDLNERQDWGERGTADSRTFAEFGRHVTEQFPARHYLTIVHGHGKAWRGLTSDRTNGGRMSLPDFARALSSFKTALGRSIDVVVLNSCYMGTWETAHTIAPYADYMVASEPFMGGVGIEQLVVKLMTRSDANAGQVARNWVDSPDEWNGGLTSRAFSVVDLRKEAALAHEVSELAKVLMSDSERFPELQKALATVWRFRNGEVVDLGGLVAAIAQIPNAPDAWATNANKVARALDQAIMVRFADDWYEKAHLVSGLTVYLPARSRAASGRYQSGAWSRATDWDKFLQMWNGYLDVRTEEGLRFSL